MHQPSRSALPGTRAIVASIVTTWRSPAAGDRNFALYSTVSTPSGELSLPLQIGLLGVTHILDCAVVYLGVALVARSALRARPGIARGVARASGIAMIAVGVVLLAERLHS